MTRSERQIILKSRPPGSQQFLCLQCYVKETGDRSAQATLTGTCHKCKSGPTCVTLWRSERVA
jgi:hypothetical protein